MGPTWADRFQAWWNGTTAMLSPHFSEREALTSSRAWGAEHIIVPTPEQLANARLLAVTVLEPIRARWGRPVKVNSWIRDAFTNQLIGGAEHSDHMNGLAADIEIPGVPSAEVYAVVKAEFLPGFPIDQLIYYSQRGHVHVSTRANPRREAWIDDDP